MSAPSTELARALVTGLVEAGVRDVVLCAGSRSAPLAYALLSAEDAGLLRLHVRHDERSAAFTALGAGAVGRAAGGGLAGALAAVVTTSGTAVANLAPAALEASEAGIPLLLLTADRPAALRGTWANQTSAHQPTLFGAVVRAETVLDGSPPHPGAAVRGAAALARGSGGSRPGPVHVDVAFTEPLVPEETWRPDGPRTRPEAAEPPDGSEHPDRPEPPDVGDPSGAPAQRGAQGAEALALGPRTVVVAGHGAGDRARELAETAGWPLLAEPSSGARSGPSAVPAYRLLLGGAAPGLAGAIERVVAFGRPTLSRPVSALLARPDVELVQVVDHPDDPGPAPRPGARRVSRVRPGAGEEDVRWAREWALAGRAVARAVARVEEARGETADEAGEQPTGDGRRGEDHRLTGLLVAREVAAATGRGDVLVAAASNAVRDLDIAAAPWQRHPLAVLSNRGVSGIDGTVSTAAGAALATGAPTRVLCGDLAFLHDLNALLLPRAELRPRVQVVVLDDDGGGIFAGLEHGEPARAQAFERLFGTPHGSDVAALAAGYGAAYEEVGTVERLRAVLSAVPSGISVVHVRARRDDRRARSSALAVAARAATASADDPGASMAPRPATSQDGAMTTTEDTAPTCGCGESCTCGADCTCPAGCSCGHGSGASTSGA